jgi:NADPH-dependent 2,4-dienoyl-CoA reductase/sulfur reductase-like enzyme
VIGAGASGVELAGLLSEQGARVTLAARQGRIDYCGSPYRRSVLEGLQAPRSGLGIGWRSWACAVAPLLVHQMPPGFREKVVTGDFGAVPGWRSRHRVETTVRVLAGATIARAVPCGGAAAVTFRLQDDAAVTVEADHVIAATGYKIDMNRLAFLGEEVRQMLDLLDGSPVLSSHFETSVPGLFVIGAAASESFGPLLRFTYGAGFASRRLSGLLGGGATRRLVAVPALRRTG